MTRHPVPALILCGFVAPLAMGCAIPTRIAAMNSEIIPQVTPVVFDSGLRAMADPVNELRVQRMLASPEVKAIQRELVSGLLDGSLAALEEKQRGARIGELSGRYAVTMVRALSREVVPAVKGAAAEALNAPSTGISPAIAGAMTGELGPALQKVLRDNLGPGLAEALGSEEVNRALGATARVMGREMVLGANEGLTTIHANKPNNGPTLLDSVSSLAAQGTSLAKVLAWLGGAAAVLLGIWVVRLLTQRRRYRREGAAEPERAPRGHAGGGRRRALSVARAGRWRRARCRPPAP